MADLLPADRSFMDRWHLWFPLVPPVGFLLRQAYPDRWLRVHTLRDAKRHPKSGIDYAELLRRLNTVAADVLGSESICTLIFVHECARSLKPDLDDTEISSDHLSDLGRLPEEFWDEETGVFDVPMCMHAGRAVWSPSAFDRLLVAVARDRVKPIFVGEKNGQIFAPYDGGVDLIFATEWERDSAREKYAAWISAREDGL